MAGGVRVIQQAACLTGVLANSAPVPSGAPYSSYLLQEAPLHAEDMKISGVRVLEIAPAAHICGSKCYIRYVPRPTCRGSVPLCMPPFSYKRRGMRRYKADPVLGSLRHSRVHTSSRSNTSHSGVGYYAPAARTTLNPCVLLCVLPPVS
jgi:hypothetical protein